MSVLQLKPEVHLWPLFPPSPLALSPRGSQCCCLADVEGAWKVLLLIFCFQLGVVTCLRSLQLRPWMAWTRETPPWKAMFAEVSLLCCVVWFVFNDEFVWDLVTLCLFVCKILTLTSIPWRLVRLGPHISWVAGVHWTCVTMPTMSTWFPSV